MNLKEIQWFDKYYDRFYNEEEFCQIIGIDYEEEGLYGLASLSGYDEEKHICWLCAKNEYYEELSSSGYEIAELIEDITGHVYIGFTYSDRLVDIDDEVKELVGYES